MILGQLIQVGRRFCECRSNDFVPKSEEEIVVIAYTIHDQFRASSFDLKLPGKMAAITSWLHRNEAVAYIMLRRELYQNQTEFPAPIGRTPMDRVIVTAATWQDFETKSYFLSERAPRDSYKLLATSCSDITSEEHSKNLFERPQRQQSDQQYAGFPEFAEFAN